MKLFFIEHLKEMEINPFNLSFGGFREKRFLYYYSSIAIRDARLAWFVGIFIYALFGVHDLIFIPQHKTTLWILRYFIVSPLMLGILFASYHKLAIRYTQILISIAILICGFGIVYSLVLVPAKEETSHSAGLILLIIYAFAFSRARFLFATSTVFILLTGFELSEIVILKRDFYSLANSNFYVFTTVFIGAFASFMIELFMRRNYFLMNLLKVEKKIAESNNRSLEVRIQERTEALNLINSNLHDVVEEKIKVEQELKKAKDHAESSNLMKSAYLANMSHEIRTPMNGILGFAQLLRQNNFTDEKKKEFIDIINDNGKLLLNLIDDIIDLAKIEAGHLKVSKTWFNIDDLLRRLKNTYQINKVSRNKEQLELFLKIPSGKANLQLFSDEKRLEQILSNLLDNALKFTEEGCIEFGYNCKNEQVVFYVKDTGIGLTPRQTSYIFERFNQGNISSSKYGGAGLGLTICNGIVELLNGTIHVESELNKGSSFYISIPRVTNTMGISTIKTEQSDLAVNSWNGKTLLVAEDEEVNYSLIYEILKETEVNILHATNGREAIDILLNKKNKIDLILMDIKMPEMNGYETILAIRNMNHEIPIIAQSAYAMHDEIEKCFRLGCNDYITKPISTHEFINCIGKYLN